MFENIYRDKVVLITGHSGFKGSWLCIWLQQLGAKVVGVSIGIPTVPSHFDSAKISKDIEDHRLDILNAESMKELIEKVQPDFVFHLAAQSLVRLSYENPLNTMMTNAIGSANLLDAVKVLDKKVVVIMITSDKAYDNVEWVWGYRETDRLGGKDPYSASKGMAELAIRSYLESYFRSKKSNVLIGIARAGNVIGGGDWAMDRIVPDCMRAWADHQIVDIRNPEATRPWQHVLEPLSGYLVLAANLFNGDENHGKAYNFGPSSDQNHPVSKLIDEMSNYWDRVKWRNTAQEGESFHEAGLLKLNCDKALFDLNWRPSLNFKDNVRMTVEWYKKYYHNDALTMHDYTVSQIEEYIYFSKLQKINWSSSD